MIQLTCDPRSPSTWFHLEHMTALMNPPKKELIEKPVDNSTETEVAEAAPVQDMKKDTANAPHGLHDTTPWDDELIEKITKGLAALDECDESVDINLLVAHAKNHSLFGAYMKHLENDVDDDYAFGHEEGDQLEDLTDFVDFVKCATRHTTTAPTATIETKGTADTALDHPDHHADHPESKEDKAPEEKAKEDEVKPADEITHEDKDTDKVDKTPETEETMPIPDTKEDATPAKEDEVKPAEEIMHDKIGNTSESAHPGEVPNIAETKCNTKPEETVQIPSEETMQIPCPDTEKKVEVAKAKEAGVETAEDIQQGKTPEQTQDTQNPPATITQSALPPAEKPKVAVTMETFFPPAARRVTGKTPPSPVSNTGTFKKKADDSDKKDKEKKEKKEKKNKRDDEAEDVNIYA